MSAEIATTNVVEPERGRLHQAIETLAAEIASLAASDLIANPRALVRIEKLTKIIKALRAEAFVVVHRLSYEEGQRARGEEGVYVGPNVVACGVDDIDVMLAEPVEHFPIPRPMRRWGGRNPVNGDGTFAHEGEVAEIEACEAKRRLDQALRRNSELQELTSLDLILSNPKSAVAERARSTLEGRVDALIRTIGATDGTADPHVVRADDARGHSPEGEEQERDAGGDLQAHAG